MEIGVSQREELIFVLNHAAELEHSLACSYLFTGFSLKGEATEGLEPDALRTVRGWKRTFGIVAYEEMMHLAVVNSLLTALGAAPHFDRPNFPHDCAYYLPDVQIELRPFSAATLRQFIGIEQPEGGNLPAHIDASRLQPVRGALENKIGPDPAQHVSQGDVYNAVEAGLRSMVQRLGSEEAVFIGPPARPALRQFYESNGWQPPVDLASTAAALAHIVEQGEGGHHVTADSHYGQFHAIEDEFEALSRHYPGFDPVRPVLINPFSRTPPQASGPVNLIDNELAVHVSDLFNECYGAMLHLLGRFFVTTEETEAEATALCDASIEMMISVLMPLGDLLTRLPAGKGQPGKTAGPSFVVHTLHPLPHKVPAWRLLRERLGELSDFTGDLARQTSDPSLEQAAAALNKVFDKLTHAS